MRRLLVVLAISNAGCGELIEEKEYVESGGIRALSALNCTTCAVLEKDGSVWCWGANIFGQLNQIGAKGPIASDGNPVAIAVPSGVEARDVSVGTMHVCIVSTSNKVYCWGSNVAGQSSPSDFEPPSDCKSLDLGAVIGPTLVDVGVEVEAVSAGALHTCALGKDKHVYCWGSNHSGQCGPTDGSKGISDIFPSIPDAQTSLCAWTVESVALASCLRKDDVVRQPSQVSGMSDVDEVVVQRNTSCARGEKFGIKCWGNNCGGGAGPVLSILGTDCSYGGQLGTAPTDLCYQEQPTNPGFQQVLFDDLNLGHLAGFGVLWPGGELYSWGWNSNGQLGLTEVGGFHGATEVKTPRKVLEVTRTNGLHQFALGDDGRYYSWGRNHCGELGRANRDSGKKESAPELPSLAEEVHEGASALTSGQDFTCYIRRDSVYCLGHRAFVGQGIAPGSLAEICGGGDLCGDTEAKVKPQPVKFE